MTQRAQESLGTLSADTLGRFLVVGIPGGQLDAATEEFLRDIQPGGVILFRRNVSTSLEDLQRLIDHLHDLPWRPFVSIDHEGGRVVRLGEPFTQFPPMARFGVCGDEDLAREVGRAMGRELATAGFDLVFAPVLDVASRPDNPVIGDRALGADAEQVARLGIALARGITEGGVLPCGKHFPGHGHTAADSHVTLPRVEVEATTLQSRELLPFAAAAAAGIPALMTAHVVYPAWDPDHPATLSPRIVRSVLRDRLHYRGLLLSDDLEMGAIAQHYEPGEAGVRALEAGVDGLLICQTTGAARAVHQALRRAWESGRLSSRLLAPSWERWQAFREQLRAERPHCPLPCPEHEQLARQLRRNAPT